MSFGEEFESYVICSNCGRTHYFRAHAHDAGRNVHIECNCGHGLNFSIWSKGDSISGYTTNVEGQRK